MARRRWAKVPSRGKSKVDIEMAVKKKAAVDASESDVVDGVTGTLLAGGVTVVDAEPESKPDPRPGDADYDWSVDYDTADLYKHTFPDGSVVALRTFAAIFSKTWMYKIRNLRTDIDIELAAIDRASCDAARVVLANLDDSQGDPIDDLWKAWIVAGAGDGEKVLTPGE